MTRASHPNLHCRVFPYRQWNGMAIWQFVLLYLHSEIIGNNTFRLSEIQSNVSVHGLHGEYLEFHSSSHRISARPSGRQSSSDGRYCVSCLSQVIESISNGRSSSSCVITSLCAPNLEFQFVNPTTQVALFSVCIGNCTSLLNITWNIYQGANSSSNSMQWTLFNQTNLYRDSWFFGE